MALKLDVKKDFAEVLRQRLAAAVYPRSPGIPVFPVFIDPGAIRVRTGMQPGNATERSQT